ncbi:MAG: hypothetical protein KDE31_18925, partial [Caldilineaceae bacterium]|nr:hypothetical protein [Caldilineaceae bacterium]
VSSTNPLGFEVRFGETPSTADYSRIIEGDIRTAGVINEIGAVSTLDQPLGSGEKLMFIVTMTANAAGTARFTGDPADISPLHDTLTYDPVQPVGFDRVRYGFDSLVIGGSFNGGGEGEGFTNLSNPFDVNADGYVSPIDVLSVINSLNNGGARPLFGGTAGGEGEASSARLYIDTNGDGFLSPIDVLSVINYLNSRLGGEGESQTAAAITQAAPMVENDKTASELLPDDLAPALAETLLSQTPAAAPTTADGAADGDRDEQLLAATDELFDSSEDAIDELLSQLAPEIDKRWKLGQV